MDDKIKKFREKLSDTKYIDNILLEDKVEERVIFFKINRKPEPYARERKGRGKHFYNPKGTIMKDIRKELIHQLSKDDYSFTREIIKNEELNYYISLDIKYFLPIPKSTSIKNMVKMEFQRIKPTIRPDLDNYNKFLLDTLHEVLYEDDKRVVRTSEEKLYSIEPRTEITAIISIIKENKD